MNRVETVPRRREPAVLDMPFCSFTSAHQLSTGSDSGGITLPRASLAMSLIAPGSPDSRLRDTTGSPDLSGGKKGDSDPFMDLLFSGWNPDLPDPARLNQ
jgi:hypothetical protein